MVFNYKFVNTDEQESHERSHIGTVQAVGYIEMRSRIEGHRQTLNQVPGVTNQ